MTMRMGSLILLCITFTILYSTIIATPVLIGAQVQSPANVTSTHKIGVKIISPSANITVPSGPLTIYGISSDTPQTNCKVYVDWNDLKPMQNVTAKGPGGANDYSNWTYSYTDKYHVIAPGINELTSKITCFDNPSNVTSKYYSVNITGLKNNTISPTLPSSGNISFGFHSATYLPQYGGLYHNIFQPIVNNVTAGRGSPNSNSPDHNNNDRFKGDADDNNGGTSDNNEISHDAKSQTNNHPDEKHDSDKSSSSSSGDSNNKHSNDGSKHEGNKEHKDSHGKKHDNNESKEKDNGKHNSSQLKQIKAHKQKH
jgi:hypothetical protein